MPVRVRLLGHLARRIGEGELMVEGCRTAGELLEELSHRWGERLPRGSVLVAINGVAASALSGESTPLRDGDLVELIPVIHGG